MCASNERSGEHAQQNIIIGTIFRGAGSGTDKQSQTCKIKRDRHKPLITKDLAALILL